MPFSWNKSALALLLSLAFQTAPAGAQNPPPSGTQADYARAESLVRSRQWDEGLEVLDSLLAKDPRNLKALNLAGIASSAKGDAQQAARYFKRALAADPHFLPALKNLSISEFNARDYASAEKHLLAVQQQVPDDPAIAAYLGEIAYDRQDFKLAAERLNRAGPLLTRDPNLAAHLATSLLRSGQKQQALDLLDRADPANLDPDSQLTLGVALAEFNGNEQAIPYLDAAFKRDPDSYDIGFDLALACVRARQYTPAVAAIQELIGRGRDSSELENLLAEAYAASGDNGNALDAYRRAIALDPADENNYLDFASFCLEHREYDDGLKVVAAGLRLHPQSERLIFMRGVLEATQDKFDLAERDFAQASLLNPRLDFGTVGLGAVYLERGNSAEALKLTRAQLRQKPHDASLLYLLGQGLIASGAAPGQPAWAEARQSLEKSVQLNPNLCLPRIALGSIYLREERYAEAATQFEAARAIDPSENSAYSHLAMAYRHLGQPGKAKAVLASLQALLEEERSGSRAATKNPPPPQTP